MEPPKTYTVEEIKEMIQDEYKTWTGTYQPIVKVALTHLLMRIDPDASI